jgi:hypothetical protein
MVTKCPNGSARARLISVILLVASIAVFHITTLRSGTPWADDFGQYIQQAKNISTGEPYDKINFVYEPGGWAAGPRLYPPVFPLILSAVYRWYGPDLTRMKLENISFFLFALILVFYAFRRRLEFRERLALVAIIGFSPTFWAYKDTILSDIPFLFFAYLALFFAEWSWSEEGQQKSWRVRGLLIGLTAWVAYATRTIGMVLIPTVLILSILRVKRIAKEAWLAAGVCVSMIIAESIVTPEFQSYATAVRVKEGSLIERLPSYIHFYIGSLSIIIGDNGHVNAARLALFLVTAIFAAVGFLLQCRKRIGAWETFIVFYIPLLFIWEEDRYLYPLTPLYFAYVLQGITALGVWKGRKLQNWVFALLILALGLSYAGKYSVVDLAPLATARPQTQELFEFARNNMTDRDVIEFSNPRMFSFFTGRRAFQYRPDERFLSDRGLLNDLNRVGATYVTTTPSDLPIWMRFVAAHQDCWDEVFKNSDFHMYRVKTPVTSVDRPCGTNGR